MSYDEILKALNIYIHIRGEEIDTVQYIGYSIYNSLPKHIRNLTHCSVSIFKSHLDKFLQNITDTPCVLHEDNSISGRLAGVYSVLA